MSDPRLYVGRDQIIAATERKGVSAALLVDGETVVDVADVGEVLDELAGELADELGHLAYVGSRILDRRRRSEQDRLVTDGGTRSAGGYDWLATSGRGLGPGRPSEGRHRNHWAYVIKDEVSDTRPLRDIGDFVTQDVGRNAPVLHTDEAQDLFADGGLPDDSSARCYDCERVFDRRHISLIEVPVDNVVDPGYEYVPVPLCEDCRLRRYGVPCDNCGEYHWDHEAVFECKRDRGRLVTDGGREEETLTVPVELTADESATVRRFEEVLGVSPEEFVREAFEGGLERAEEFLEEYDQDIVTDGGLTYSCDLCGRAHPSMAAAIRCCDHQFDDNLDGGTRGYTPLNPNAAAAEGAESP